VTHGRQRDQSTEQADEAESPSVSLSRREFFKSAGVTGSAAAASPLALSVRETKRPSRVTGPRYLRAARSEMARDPTRCYFRPSGSRTFCEGPGVLVDESLVASDLLTDPAAWAAPEAIVEAPVLLASNILVPPSKRTLRVDEVITEPSALPADDETNSRPLMPNTPLLLEVSIPLELSPPTAPAE
jgi:hypothetical protein